jgi:hypothetical protein
MSIRINRRTLLGLAAVVSVFLGGIAVDRVSAANSPSVTPTPLSFVSITPCRLADTRFAGVGTRSRPITQGEAVTFTVRGANGNCSIPAEATSITTNITILNPTASSFLTVFPSDTNRPQASHLNWVAGASPTPNAVTSKLSSTGAVKIYNQWGTVDIIIDIAGYFVPSVSGPQGLKGDVGAQGPPGSVGQSGADGQQGEQGETGTPGISGFEYMTSTGSFLYSEIRDSIGGGIVTGPSCPTGKVLLNQGIEWSTFNTVDPWKQTFPVVLRTQINRVIQAPEFLIVSDKTVENGRWDYTIRTLCASGTPAS